MHRGDVAFGVDGHDGAANGIADLDGFFSGGVGDFYGAAGGDCAEGGAAIGEFVELGFVGVIEADVVGEVVIVGVGGGEAVGGGAGAEAGDGGFAATAAAARADVA